MARYRAEWPCHCGPYIARVGIGFSWPACTRLTCGFSGYLASANRFASPQLATFMSGKRLDCPAGWALMFVLCNPGRSVGEGHAVGVGDPQVARSGRGVVAGVR